MLKNLFKLQKIIVQHYNFTSKWDWISISSTFRCFVSVLKVHCDTLTWHTLSSCQHTSKLIFSLHRSRGSKDRTRGNSLFRIRMIIYNEPELVLAFFLRVKQKNVSLKLYALYEAPNIWEIKKYILLHGSLNIVSKTNTYLVGEIKSLSHCGVPNFIIASRSVSKEGWGML
jgi:hypothetical protein